MRRVLTIAVFLGIWVQQVGAQSGFYPKPAGDADEVIPQSTSASAEVLEPIAARIGPKLEDVIGAGA